MWHSTFHICLLDVCLFVLVVTVSSSTFDIYEVLLFLCHCHFWQLPISYHHNNICFSSFRSFLFFGLANFTRLFPRSACLWVVTQSKPDSVAMQLTFANETPDATETFWSTCWIEVQRDYQCLSLICHINCSKTQWFCVHKFPFLWGAWAGQQPPPKTNGNGQCRALWQTNQQKRILDKQFWIFLPAAENVLMSCCVCSWAKGVSIDIKENEKEPKRKMHGVRSSQAHQLVKMGSKCS